MSKLSSSVRFFYCQGVSRGLLCWLMFRQSINVDHWAESARNIVGAESNDNAALSLWLRAQPSYSVTDIGNAWLVGAVGVCFGALSVAGACSYSGAEPVNLWLLLILFALLPLLFTLFICFGWRSALHASTGPLPALSQLLFRPVLKRLPISALTAGGEPAAEHQCALLKPWLLWKLQWLAVAFQLSALITFYLMALFQDLAFAWSSTVGHF